MIAVQLWHVLDDAHFMNRCNMPLTRAAEFCYMYTDDQRRDLTFVQRRDMEDLCIMQSWATSRSGFGVADCTVPGNFSTSINLQRQAGSSPNAYQESDLRSIHLRCRVLDGVYLANHSGGWIKKHQIRDS